MFGQNRYTFFFSQKQIYIFFFPLFFSFSFFITLNIHFFPHSCRFLHNFHFFILCRNSEVLGILEPGELAIAIDTFFSSPELKKHKYIFFFLLHTSNTSTAIIKHIKHQTQNTSNTSIPVTITLLCDKSDSFARATEWILNVRDSEVFFEVSNSPKKHIRYKNIYGTYGLRKLKVILLAKTLSQYGHFK